MLYVFLTLCPMLFALCIIIRAGSSAGRMSRSQRECRRFKSAPVHHFCLITLMRFKKTQDSMLNNKYGIRKIERKVIAGNERKNRWIKNQYGNQEAKRKKAYWFLYRVIELKFEDTEKIKEIFYHKGHEEKKEEESFILLKSSYSWWQSRQPS